MFQRAASIILLLSANIILLAMSAVPHHHHGDAVCFSETHCMHGTGCENGHDDACDHRDAGGALPEREHEHPKDAGCCNVSAWLLPNIEPEHRHEPHYFCTGCDNDTDFPVAVIPGIIAPLSQPPGFPIRKVSTGGCCLQTFTGRTPGLRAPPFNGTLPERI